MADALSAGALAGKVALVTGSSRGIGAAIARLFAEQGAKVAVHGRDPARLSAVRAEIERDGGRAVAVAADVTRAAELERMRGEVEGALGPVEVLVANAGGPHALGPLEDTTEEAWRASIDGNLTSTFLTLKCFLPGMKARRAGSIVTVSSYAGHVPHVRSPAAYSAAKAGVEIVTRIVAGQAGPFGIRVNCVSPETILTEENDRRIPFTMRPQLVGRHAVRRLGTPEDVARAALFLASESAGWITGVVLDVAGGPE